MNETVTKGIVLRAINHKESDKLITIFSLDFGKITALLKGVNKMTAKLKFAGQPFCFAEFTLVKKGDLFIVVNASEIESFFGLNNDFNKLSAGFAILETAQQFDEEKNTGLLVQILKALKFLCYEIVEPKIVLIKYFLEVLKLSGYGLNMERCQNCGGAFNTHILIDVDFGNFVCGLCRTSASIELSLNEHAILKLIDKTDFNKIGTIKAKPAVLNSLVKALSANFCARFGCELKSLKNI